MKPFVFSSMISCLCIFTTLSSKAGDVHWLLPSTGYWDVAANWDTGNIPIGTDNVFNDTAQTIDVSNDLSSNYAASAYALTNDGGGTIYVENGVSLTAAGAVSNSSASTLQADGPGSVLNLGDSRPLPFYSLTNDNSTISSTNTATVNLYGSSVNNQDNGSLSVTGIVDFNTNTFKQSFLNIGSALSQVATVNNTGGLLSINSLGTVQIYANTFNNKSSSTINLDSFASLQAGSDSSELTSFTNDNSSITATSGSIINFISQNFTNQNSGQIIIGDPSAQTYDGSGIEIGDLKNVAQSVTNNDSSITIYSQNSSIYTSNYTNENGSVLKLTGNPSSNAAGGLSFGTSYGGTEVPVQAFINDHSSILINNSAGLSVAAVSFSNQNGSTLNVDGSQTQGGPSSQLALGDNADPLSTLKNNASTISATNGGQIQVFSNSFSNQAYAIVSADGSDTVYTVGNFNVSPSMISLGYYSSTPNHSVPIVNFTNDSTSSLEVSNLGIINVTATTFTNSGSILVNSGGAINLNVTNFVNQGTINIDSTSLMTIPGGYLQLGPSALTKVDGTLDTSGGTLFLDGGVLNGTGINSTLKGEVNQSGATFNPGEDPSTFNITGNYILNGGILQIDVASPTSFDILNVGGTTNLNGGTLSLDFLNGYVPTSGSAYKFLLDSGGISGNFNSITSNLNGLGFAFNPGNGTVSFGAPPPVPEASSVLTLLGFLGLGCISGRRRSTRLQQSSSGVKA